MRRNRHRETRGKFPSKGNTSAVESRDSRFLDDIARIAQGEEPSEAELARAPVLSAWRIVLHPQDGLPALVGTVTGHPIVGPGRIVTSPLLAIGPGGAWARTVSRFYALGVPDGEVVS